MVCALLELPAAECLIDPQGQGGLFTKDVDHLAQTVELVGVIQANVKMSGRGQAEAHQDAEAMTTTTRDG